MGKIILEEQTEPATPATDKVVMYPKAGGGLYVKNDAGTESLVGGTHAAFHIDGTDDIQSATTSQKGLLTNTDWNTFNGKAASGANGDITSMTGLSDDGIPLAKVANALSDTHASTHPAPTTRDARNQVAGSYATSGANSDITSMTGLSDDGIPGAKVVGALPTALAVADLSDTATPSVLTVAETTNKTISNYKSSGADHVFTMPAAHINGSVIFVIGDEFQVDIEPYSGANFFLNGVAMAADEHIQNTADTLGDEIVGYIANINGTLTWMFKSSSANFVEETPA